MFNKKTHDPDFEANPEFEQDPGFLEWICQRVRNEAAGNPKKWIPNRIWKNLSRQRNCTNVW